MTQTQTAFLRAPWQVELRTVDLPAEPPSGFALIKIHACGICGTDLTAAASKAKAWGPFGHEVAGEIAKVAADEKRLQVGQSVVLESGSYCGHCDLCRDGRVDLCNKAPSMWGQPAMGFGQYMIAPVQCIVPYDGLTPEAASLTEPLGVAIDMVKTADIAMGDGVAIVGPGPIGLMAVAVAKHSGATKVVCIGHAHSSKRLEVARQLGAEPIAHDGPLDQLKELSKKFQHVLLTAPVQFLPQSISLLTYGGRLTYIGIGEGDGNVTFDANDFHYRKLQLRASFASPAIYYPTALKLMKAGIVPPEKIISHRFPLEKVGEAMELCRDDKKTVVKIVVTN